MTTIATTTKEKEEAKAKENLLLPTTQYSATSARNSGTWPPTEGTKIRLHTQQQLLVQVLLHNYNASISISPRWITRWLAFQEINDRLTTAEDNVFQDPLSTTSPTWRTTEVTTVPTTCDEPDREEHSMDQCRSRLKLSENFERHWSILISGVIHMDQSLVNTFSWGKSYGPMVLKIFLKFPPALVLVRGCSSQPEPSEPFSQEQNVELEPPEPFPKGPPKIETIQDLLQIEISSEIENFKQATH